MVLEAIRHQPPTDTQLAGYIEARKRLSALKEFFNGPKDTPEYLLRPMSGDTNLDDVRLRGLEVLGRLIFAGSDRISVVDKKITDQIEYINKRLRPVEASEMPHPFEEREDHPRVTRFPVKREIETIPAPSPETAVITASPELVGIEDENDPEELQRLDRSFYERLKAEEAELEEVNASDFRGLGAMGQFLKEISRRPLLDADQEKALAERIENGDQAAFEVLVESNLRLVVSIARKYFSNVKSMTPLDLIQEGSLGLMTAARKFDRTRNLKFSTYATWWVRQAISRAVSNQEREIRLPVHIIETLAKFNRTMTALTHELGREPSRAEIAERMDWKVETVDEFMTATMAPTSLNKTVGRAGGDPEDTELGDFIPDRLANTEREASATLDRAYIDELFSILTDKERRVMGLRFGLDDERDRTLEEVGVEMGVSREWIRQIEARALKKLRAHNRHLAAVTEAKARQTLAKAEIRKDIKLKEVPKAIINEAILKFVAEASGLKIDELTGVKRDAEIAIPRQIAMYLMRANGMSLNAIGKILGGRDHTTVMYGVAKIKQALRRSQSPFIDFLAQAGLEEFKLDSNRI